MRYLVGHFLLVLLLVISQVNIVYPDLCGPHCTTDDDCEEGYICYHSELSVMNNICVKSCSSDVDCGSDEICDDGVCRIDDSAWDIGDDPSLIPCHCDLDCAIYEDEFVEGFVTDPALECGPSGHCQIREGKCIYNWDGSGGWLGCEDDEYCSSDVRDNNCHPIVGECTDTDGGWNEFERGTVSGYLDGDYGEYTDYCISQREVYEYACDTSGSVIHRRIYCGDDKFCRDGMCTEHECETDDDCEPYQFCNESYRCELKERGCRDDRYCPGFAYCNEDHVCVINDRYKGYICWNDSDCYEWQYCDESDPSHYEYGTYVCHTRPGRCAQHSDCDIGYMCNEDHYCVESTLTETICHDHQDNDNDGLIDCEDPDCDGIDHCEYGRENTCFDGIDNDGDGAVDCEDDDCNNKYCGSDPYRECIDHECVETNAPYEIDCSNGIDDDGNGLIDCADPRCNLRNNCQYPREWTCNDSFDNDGDGKIDCEDDDCEGLRCSEEEHYICYEHECISVEHGWPCDTDDDCADNMYCNEYGGCSELECDDDEIAHDHKCVPRCESDDDCEDDEFCAVYCRKVECEGREMRIINHRCVYVGEEGCITNSDCADDERCLNNTCIKITGECGYAQNHTWINYECCNDDECGDNFICVNHSCVPAQSEESNPSNGSKKETEPENEESSVISHHPSEETEENHNITYTNETKEREQDQNITSPTQNQHTNPEKPCILPTTIILLLLGYYVIRN